MDCEPKMNERPPFFAKAMAMFESDTDCIIADTKGMFSDILGVSPLRYFTSGVRSETASGVHSLVVKPGISRYSLKVLEMSSIMCAIVDTVLKCC